MNLPKQTIQHEPVYLTGFNNEFIAENKVKISLKRIDDSGRIGIKS